MENRLSGKTVRRVLSQLIADEGWRSKPYRCTSGALTIGVGHNLDAEGLCAEAIWAQLEHDEGKARKAAARVCGAFWDRLDEVRQDALTMWAFQLGENGMRQFGPTLALIEVGKYAQAADRLLKTKWARQTPARVFRLAKMIERGRYDGN